MFQVFEQFRVQLDGLSELRLAAFKQFQDMALLQPGNTTSPIGETGRYMRSTAGFHGQLDAGPRRLDAFFERSVVFDKTIDLPPHDEFLFSYRPVINRPI